MPLAAITARQIITLALKEAGQLGVGQTPLAEDINDSFTRLQGMIEQWQKRRWMVPALKVHTINCTGAISYTIGPGGNVDTIRPNKISSAWVVQLNTGSNPISMPLRPIFSYEDYSLISVKNLSSLPDRFFYDAAWPLGNFFPFPIPNNQYAIYFTDMTDLGWPDTLDDVFSLPNEYLEAIHYNLAIRLCSQYQLSPQSSTVTLAKLALQTIRSANAQIPRLGMPATYVSGGGFNIWNPDGY